MAELTLEVARREQTGTGVAKKLRRDGKVPAVVYGGDREPVTITVDARDMSNLVNKSEHGIRSVFLLKLSDSDQSRHAMIRDVQVDPISRRMQHVDFVRVDMNTKVHVMIPIHMTGTAKGVKEEGGILDQQLREIEVECLPGNIPDELVVDVSNLQINDYIRLSDLELPADVELYDAPEGDPVIAGVVPKQEEIVEEEDELGLAEEGEPEVISRGKEDDEDEESSDEDES